MRREFIQYMQELPLNIRYESIKGYPIHWHESMEIVYCLKGTVDVTIETETHTLREGELEIINLDEAHAFFSKDGENEVLIIQIDNSFFQKYYDISNMFFYTESGENGAQLTEKYEELRRILSIILCEVSQKGDDYEDIVEENLVKLLYHLINNFHYLIYDEEGLKDNEVQFERYDRITKYIFSNYSNKISLQDIARREFLSSHYLSHEIKNNVGYNFKEFLNLTRVEEGIKLLLDSDKNISEISEELGFSHPRYFNKHFKKYLNLTPMQYRKKYNLNEKQFEKKKQHTSLDIKKALEEVFFYLEDYTRFNYEDRIVKVDVDVNSSKEELDKNFQRVINIGSALEVLKEKQKRFLEEIQEEVEFKYVLINDLFSKEMNVFSDEENNFFYWEEVKEALEFLIDLDLKPIIVINKSLKNIEFLFKMLDSFESYFMEYFGEYAIKKWMFAFTEDYPDDEEEQVRKIMLEKYYFEIFDDDYIYTSVDTIYDTTYMIPYIINKHLNLKQCLTYITAFDQIYGRENINNEQFFGGAGLINKQGIKKPSYYAYYLLSRLGDNVIQKGEGYVITEKDEDIQILLYTYEENMEDLISMKELYKRKINNSLVERKFSINIEGLSSDYKVTEYEINEKKGSSFNYWLELGKPKRLDEEEKSLLTKASFPAISLAFAKKSPVYNIVAKVQGYGAVLITLQKVQKQLS